jgi:2-oxoglutarate dehydrogenase complex dehydrogenase (E1) component-like enzyme
MIDQFVASGETKWNLRNGLVMLLPHGYDGAGPEHSSCRIERFLQLTDAGDEMPPEDERNSTIHEKQNMRVCNPSTSANYFHLLRSQVRRPIRKPLIVVSPKKLLKFKGASSDIEEFGTGLRYRKVIPDCGESMVADDKVRRVVFCSGQVYYDLEAARKKRGAWDVAIVRVEQLAPFPFRGCRAEI